MPDQDAAAKLPERMLIDGKLVGGSKALATVVG
jgi:hypothetical protein